MPCRFHRLLGVAILLTCASTLPAEEKKTAAPTLTDAQAAVAAGKRVMEVSVDSVVRHPADQFAVSLEVTSGVATPEQTAPRIEKLVDHVQDALRIAALPPLVADPTTPAREAMSGNGGTVASFARYRATVTSLAQARAVQAALAPFTLANRGVTEVASIMDTVRVETRSTKLDADYRGTIAAARTQGLAEAYAQAEENAAALKLKLGPPLFISAIDVSAASSNDSSAEKTFFVRGTILFEILPN